jgi:heme A synthase
MSLLALIVILVAIGVCLWLVNRHIKMEENVKQILNVAVLIVVVFILLHAFGILDELRSVKVPKL